MNNMSAVWLSVQCVQFIGIARQTLSAVCGLCFGDHSEISRRCQRIGFQKTGVYHYINEKEG